jgi:hypothetical protein
MSNFSPIVSKNGSPSRGDGPYLKNDQCHVEQKNGAIVRQVIGYARLEGERAYQQLREVYQALRLYINGFQPSMKLQAKHDDGRKVRRIYDGVKTPLQRLLLAGVLPASKEQEIAASSPGIRPTAPLCAPASLAASPLAFYNAHLLRGNGGRFWGDLAVLGPAVHRSGHPERGERLSGGDDPGTCR